MKQRVLVLGASGFIGRRVVAGLAETSWAVPVAAGYRSELAPGWFETVRLDAADKPALVRALMGVDAVINCVAGSTGTIVATSRALFGVLSRAPRPMRVVHLSSMAVYGLAAGIVDEAAPLRSDGGAYALAKVQAEHFAASCSDVVTLRPGCVYGPGSVQWSERIAGWLRARRIGDLGEAGDGFCNLVYVDDVVTAILAGLRLPRAAGQAFNLGSPAPPTWNEYFLQFARALGAVPICRISRRRLALETNVWAPPLRVGELALRLARLRGISVPTPIPLSLARSWSRELRLDVRRAEQALGMAWTPVDTGLRLTARHLQPAQAA